MRSVVVLPAPFGPRNPVIVPASSANERSSTASTEPNLLHSESARTTGATPSTLAERASAPVGVALVAIGEEQRRDLLGTLGEELRRIDRARRLRRRALTGEPKRERVETEPECGVGGADVVVHGRQCTPALNRLS